MSWKQWFLGLIVAQAEGALTGVITLAVGVSYSHSAWIVGTLVAKNALQFLTSASYRQQVFDSLPSNGTTAHTASAVISTPLAETKDKQQ